MALAILEFLSIDKEVAKFKIDTGTNKHYYFKIGKEVSERNGLQWVDAVTTKTTLQKNENSETLINSGKEVSLASGLFSKEDCYLQLFTFKNNEGKSPAVSKVIKVPVAINIESDTTDLYALSKSINTSEMADHVLNPHRNIPHVDSRRRYSSQASFEDILSTIIKMAGPVVMGILSGSQKKDTASNATKADIPQIGMFNTILDTLLRELVKETPHAPPPVSKVQTLSHSSVNNRFLNPAKRQFPTLHFRHRRCRARYHCRSFTGQHGRACTGHDSQTAECRQRAKIKGRPAGE